MTSKKTGKRKAASAKKTTETKKGGGNESPTIFGLPQTPVLLALVVIAFGAGIFMSNNKSADQPNGGSNPTATTTIISAATTSTIPSVYGNAKLEFYIMSQCPYGTQVEDAIKPVLDKLGKSVDFTIDFIANDNGDGTFTSLHGQAEVDEDIRQLCAMEYYPDKYMDYIVCRNTNIQDTNWQSCATQAGLDTNTIQSCFSGGEGKTLMSASIQKSMLAQASGSPTMYLNNQLYSGARDSLSFQRAICKYISSHPECSGLPACAQDADCNEQTGKIGTCENPGTNDARCTYSDPVAFEVIVLNDAGCGTACDPTRINSITKQYFLGATFRDVDVSSDEGKKLVEELGITVVPSFLFEDRVTQTYQWVNNVNIRGAFERKGNYYKLMDEQTGATWFVSEEARQAYEDAVGLTPGDNKPQIDFFVMSYCPYGNQAEEIAAGVYDLLGDKAEYIPHYVIYENYGGGGPDYCMEDGKYCSMHGIQELNQNIREMCVYNSLGIGKYFEFVKEMNAKCSASNADSCWTSVASGLGIDTTAVSECEKNQGLEITKKDRDLNVILKVSGSPTVFVEGEQYAGARSVAGFMSALCAKFDTPPAECSNIPAEDAATAAAVPAGSC